MRRRPPGPLVAAILLALTPALHASSAQWNASPATNDWNTATNWTPATEPNDPADTATFDVSDTTSIFIGSFTRVAGVTFNTGASSFTITLSPFQTFTISGAGIVNNSQGTQNFVAAGNDATSNFALINFTNSATAGTSTTFTNNSNAFGIRGGTTQFNNSSTAGSATFTNNGATNDHGPGGITLFYNTSSAAHGTLVNNSGTVSDAHGGSTEFHDSSSAGDASLTNLGGVSSSIPGHTIFWDTSSADHATLFSKPGAGVDCFGGSVNFTGSSTADHAIVTAEGAAVSGANGGAIHFNANATAGSATLIATAGVGPGSHDYPGGHIYFSNDATGGTARVELFGNGTLDISLHDAPGVTIGSIEGDGNVFLGARTLIVGSSNASTSFSGAIQDGGYAANTGGSLSKIGTGTLTLSGANTYTGATTVNGGALIVNGSITSATTVNSGGTFGGSGTARAVTVNSDGILSPGNSPGILNVQGNLTLTLGATYLVDLNGAAVGTEYDQTNVTGLVNLDNATLSLSLAFTPAGATTFKIINNDLGDPVNGTFNGLAEGATFSVGGQTFTISYVGGDGNDVVLNVVPEPAIWAFLIAGCPALVAFRRRKH